MDIRQFISRHEEQIKSLEKRSRSAWWNLAVTGEERYADELRDSLIALRKIYSSADDYRFLISYSSECDAITDRQKTLLIQNYAENQISPENLETIVRLETEIESIFTNFRPTIGEASVSVNELKEILAKNTDSYKRKEAWEASKEIGNQAELRVLELVKLRNRNARSAGFDNYYSMKLKLQEIDEKRLFELCDEFDRSIVPEWNDYKNLIDRSIAEEMSISPEEIMPWHYSDPFFQEAPSYNVSLDYYYENKNIEEIGAMFFENLDLNIKDILKHSDLYERANKNQHAFCTCIDREQDIRILCNLKSNENWTGILLHEAGHAVYDRYIDSSLPFLLREPSHICMTEAIAMFFGRLSKNSAFIQTYCEIPEPIDPALTEKISDQSAASLLVFSRWALVMIHFERALYREPESDLNALWWEYVNKFQGIRKPEGRDAPDWASKLHLACAPVYYQNYLLGEMIAGQLKHYGTKLTEEKGILPSKETGEWLKNSIFRSGKQFPWEETLRRATGEGLNPMYLLKEITRGKTV